MNDSERILSRLPWALRLDDDGAEVTVQAKPGAVTMDTLAAALDEAEVVVAEVLPGRRVSVYIPRPE